jgi:molybdopterin biosynthesis enzyme MoaB
VGLERGPLSLVSTTEELLQRKSSGFGLEIRYTAVGDLAPTSLTSGGRSVAIVRSRTQATEFVFLT